MLTLSLPFILRPTLFLLTPHLLLPAPPCLFLFIPFFLSPSRAGKPTDPRREQKAGGGRRGVGGGTSSQGPGPVKDHTVVVEAVCRDCLIGARELSVLCVGISNRQVKLSSLIVKEYHRCRGGVENVVGVRVSSTSGVPTMLHVVLLVTSRGVFRRVPGCGV